MSAEYFPTKLSNHWVVTSENAALTVRIGNNVRFKRSHAGSWQTPPIESTRAPIVWRQSDLRIPMVLVRFETEREHPAKESEFFDVTT